MEVEPDIKDLEIRPNNQDFIKIWEDWLMVGNDLRNAMGLEKITLEQLLKPYNEDQRN